MSNTIIKVENLSKSYMIQHEGQERYMALRDVLSNKAKSVFSFGRKRTTNQASDLVLNPKTSYPTTEEFWALKDLNFEIKQGDRVGIIGRNGAGKSTLLKILSRITEPTSGRITLNGRVASLLEVGTGFHPELTGRENIYLNGAILGMSRSEIKRKFDEIVDFAEVERFLDTPVKRYSSGMYVRLAFAVAAHLEPEILIVDEVLAVGDYQFQKKCMGKMEDVSKNEGRTVLFVSHNMTAIANLCNNLIVLKNGSKDFIGTVNLGIDHFLSVNLNNRRSSIQELYPEDESFKLINFKVGDVNLINKEFFTKDQIRIKFLYTVKKKVSGLRLGFDLIDSKSGTTIFRTFHDDQYSADIIDYGDYSSEAEIPSNFLKPGDYSINLAIGIHNVKWISFDKISIPFSVINIDGINNKYADYRPGVIMPNIMWINKNLIK